MHQKVLRGELRGELYGSIGPAAPAMGGGISGLPVLAGCEVDNIE
jgi:hypothetical protein